MNPESSPPSMFADGTSRHPSGRFRYVNVAPMCSGSSLEDFLDNDGKIVRESDSKQRQRRLVQLEKEEKKTEDPVDLIGVKMKGHEDAPVDVIDLRGHEDDISYIYGSFAPTHHYQQKSQVGSVVVFRTEPSQEIKDRWSWQRMMDESQWDMLYRAIELWRGDPVLVHNEMVLESGTTALHICSWKAPPSLTLLLLEVLSSSENESGVGVKDYLLTGDCDGNTPLACACANLEAEPEGSATAIEFSVIKNLLLTAPEALDMVNSYGDTPLHLLLASKAFRRGRGVSFAVEVAANEAIASLLLMAEHLAAAQNKAGCTLLHVAIASDCHELVLSQLVTMMPEAMTVADAQGMLPLHYVAAYGSSLWTVAKQLTWSCPGTICCQTENGDTPLHLLVTNARRNIMERAKLDDEQARERFHYVHRCTIKLAELLMGTGEEKFPPLLIQNCDGLTPLHCCASFDAPAQLTRFLVEHCAADRLAVASILKTKYGSTALHLAVSAMKRKSADNQDAWQRENIVANVRALATIEACAMQDAKGRTPLMLAVESKKGSSSVVKSLLETLPESAAVMTSKCLLPLHLACQNKRVQPSVIKALVKVYPQAITAVTKKGNTPVHEAVKWGVSADAVKLMIDKVPGVAYVRNLEDERPIECAIAKKDNPKLLALLEKATHGGHTNPKSHDRAKDFPRLSETHKEIPLP